MGCLLRDATGRVNNNNTCCCMQGEGEIWVSNTRFTADGTLVEQPASNSRSPLGGGALTRPRSTGGGDYVMTTNATPKPVWKCTVKGVCRWCFTRHQHTACTAAPPLDHGTSASCAAREEGRGGFWLNVCTYIVSLHM